MINIAILLQQLIASLTHIIAKDVTQQESAEVILLFRALIATAFYFIFLAFRKKAFKRIEPKDWLLVIILGILNIPINQYLFLIGIKYTSAPNVSLAYALSPVFVFIIAAIFLKERLTTNKILGIFLAVIGAVVLLSEKGFSMSSESLKGDIYALLASLSWALYTVIGRDFTRKYGAIYSTALAMLSGLIFFFPFYFYYDGSMQFGHISLVSWWQIFYLGAITSGVGYALWFYALKKIDASKLSVFNNLQPVLTAALAFLIFGTGVSLYFIIGGIMIIIGVVLTQKSK